jgi:hypothetical protein
LVFIAFRGVLLAVLLPDLVRIFFLFLMVLGFGVGCLRLII